MDDINAALNRAIMGLVRRAERVDRKRLVETFVDVGSLFALLSSEDHQIVFGRRGTGKTHALNYLSDVRGNEGDAVVYIDLSNMGSSGGLYADSNIPIPERATRLLVDTLQEVHDRLLSYFVDRAEEHDLSKAGSLLDNLADASSSVRVVGETIACIETSNRNDRHAGAHAAFSVSLRDTGAELGAGVAARCESVTHEALHRAGRESHVVHFSSVRRSVERLAELISPQKIWILLDEWSSVPRDLQPYLADLVKRSLFPIRGVIVKIAAIEQRSCFAIAKAGKDYIGIELGADVAADVNLDDFMVFDNDASRARAFYQSLFYRHITATVGDSELARSLRSEKDFIRCAFTQSNTFDELVRASEGVPRDAINILIQAAQYARGNPIAMEDVRRAAHAWYQRDKEPAIQATEGAVQLLQWIVQEVIGKRRARAFLLRTDVRDSLIEALFDGRVLHILKKNISTHDEPGIRYNVYKLDYGCYVDLINTARATKGLLPLDQEDGKGEVQYIEVPPDDYRAIRRAILRLEEFRRGVHGSSGEEN